VAALLTVPVLLRIRIDEHGVVAVREHAELWLWLWLLAM
jgi:hypothetical protein